MRLLLSLIMILTGFVTIAADEEGLLHQISERLEFHGHVEGLFRQEKHLHFMRHPFTSNGEFSTKDSKNLVWQVVEPVHSKMVVSDGQVFLDGQIVSDYGVGVMLSSLMGSFASGRLEELSDHFDIRGGISENGWGLTLMPTNRILANMLSNIEVRGNTHPESIHIFEQEGSYTIINFHDVKQISNRGGKKIE